jgi:multidrug efflux pump subunit AcrA (membrane-fusion protein)
MNESPENGRRRKITRETLKASGAVLILVLLMAWLAGGFVRKVRPGPVKPVEPVQGIKFRAAEKRIYPVIVDQVGTVKSRTEAQVSSRIMAQVKEILVREGESVNGGDEGDRKATIMARLDDGDIRARLRQAEAQLSAAEKAKEIAGARLGSVKSQAEAARANRGKALSDYDRYADLQRNQAATGQQVEHARALRDSTEAQLQSSIKETQAAHGEIERVVAQREQAEAAVAEARAMLNHTVIQAPFTGKVIRKMVNVGDMAAPGQPLFLMEAQSTPELHAYVTESLVPFLKTGQKFSIWIDALGSSFPAVLSEIVPRSDPATRTVLVKVSLPPDPRLINGLYGRLPILYDHYETVVVSSDSVLQSGQLDFVRVVDESGGVRRRFVTLGQRREGFVEVLTGLKEGEKVVVP